MSSQLLPPNSTPLERALADTADLERIDPSPIASLWNADTCPSANLPWLAWALHVDNWDEAATEAQQREAIKLSVMLHRKKGTPWAVKRALSTLGVEIDLLDQRAQREIYAALNNSRLDGTWKLDGSRNIIPLERITGVPQIQHWAQFIVRMNIAELARPALLAKMRELINEWKPARSWPLFTFWLRFYFTVTMTAESRFIMQKRIPARYPWCGRVISDREDARWKLGRDGEPVRIPAPFGSFRIGERRGEAVSWWLTSCRNRSDAALTIRSQVPMWPLQRLAPELGILMSPAPVKLFRHRRKLDGSWRIGTSTRLDGTWKLDGSRRLPRHTLMHNPRFGSFKLYEPQHPYQDPGPANLQLGRHWRLGGPVQPASRIVITRSN